MSAFKDGKFFFDEMFVSKWTRTPVHYAGQEFDGKGKTEWVNPSFSPTSRANASLAKSVKQINANIFVACWAETDVDVMDLMDEVSDFMDTNAGPAYQILNTAVVDHGWHESNKVFGILMFTITYKVGTCAPTKPPTSATVVVHNGTTVVNNGTILTKS